MTSEAFRKTSKNVVQNIPNLPSRCSVLEMFLNVMLVDCAIFRNATPG